MKNHFLIILLLPIAAYADDVEYKLAIKDHFFQPAKLSIPTGKKIKLIIENQDSSPEEFDSYELNREKSIAGNSSVTIFIGPLSPGDYKFSGEFHATTAQGLLIVK
jgi:hypothetical protein